MANFTPMNNTLQSDSSAREDFRALWMLRSKVLFADLGFWLIILGWDTKQRRFTNKGYLVYAVLFFALWIFMVLLLLADFSARVLQGLPAASIGDAAVLLGALGLWGWFLIELNAATRRSPFHFSEQDAQLLCQTPLDRRVVALEWMLEGWVKRSLAVWPTAIVLGYALIQAQSVRQLAASDLPAYLLAGALALSAAAPLSLLIIGLAWSAGALHLRGQYDQANLRWLAPLLFALTAAAGLLLGWQGLLAALFPLAYPLRAGLRLVPYPFGEGLALALAVLGPVAVWIGAKGMSLSRAAQETSPLPSGRAAGGPTSAVGDAAVERRLGSGVNVPAAAAGSASGLVTGTPQPRAPVWSGAGALLWKSITQARRRVGAEDALGFFGLFAVNLALLTFPGTTTLIGLVTGWILIAAQQAVAPLRRELARWWLVRSLPFRASRLVVSTLALPVAGFWLAGLAIWLVWALMGHAIAPIPIWIYLFSAPGVALGAATDVLRQSKTSNLLAGSVPGVGLLGIVLGLLLVALNGGAAWLIFTSWLLPAPLAWALLLGWAAGLDWIYLSMTSSALRGIR